MQRKLSQLGYAFRWRQPNIFTPNILQALYTGNRWILQDALSYFYATELWQPIKLFILAQWAAGCNNKSLQRFSEQEREFLLILQLCTVRVIHTLDFFLLKSITVFQQTNWIWKILILRLVLCLNWSPFLFCCNCRELLGKVMACWAWVAPLIWSWWLLSAKSWNFY